MLEKFKYFSLIWNSILSTRKLVLGNFMVFCKICSMIQHMCDFTEEKIFSNERVPFLWLDDNELEKLSKEQLVIFLLKIILYFFCF